jgi:glycosyltransferase involved in cell wall biosynthesis
MSGQPTAPLISVALCTYNGAPYLREQLDSVLMQTYGNIEVVAVDDCSTDTTLSILEDYRVRDSRLRVHQNPANIGFRRNFERAMTLCAGQFVAPCDQDDVWAREKLSTLYEVIAGHALAYCNSGVIDAQGRPVDLAMSDQFEMVSTDDPAVFSMTNCVSGHAMLFQRALLERALPVPESFFHDWWLAAVAASSGGIIYCNRKLVQYRQHGGNITDTLVERREKRRRNHYAGYRWDRERERVARVSHLARLPGSSQLLLARLRDLLIARQEAWLSPRLASFMYQYGQRLYGLQKAPRSRLGYFLRFLPGLRLKRLAKPRSYTPTRATLHRSKP